MNKLLLHVCCAPCALFPANMLRGREDFTLYFFNPNIHPYQEFKKRLSAVREFAQADAWPLIEDKNYELEEFLRGALAEPLGRCRYCYRLRMRQTAKIAASRDFAAFSTTLLVSPYQRHDLIKELARAAADEFGVKFYYEDFRAGFAEGTRLSRERNIYRQAYCGCVFSERDRYEKKKK